jgi:hypothetical protein
MTFLILYYFWNQRGGKNRWINKIVDGQIFEYMIYESSGGIGYKPERRHFRLRTKLTGLDSLYLLPEILHEDMISKIIFKFINSIGITKTTPFNHLPNAFYSTNILRYKDMKEETKALEHQLANLHEQRIEVIIKNGYLHFKQFSEEDISNDLFKSLLDTEALITKLNWGHLKLTTRHPLKILALSNLLLISLFLSSSIFLSSLVGYQKVIHLLVGHGLCLTYLKVSKTNYIYFSQAIYYLVLSLLFTFVLPQDVIEIIRFYNV